jgi:hypothetical protein
MRLTDLTIDGFGALTSLQLDELDCGLNVIHGPNGSGKTTVLQFLRGVWGGFDDARRLRLLPPIAGGQPGGSVGIASGERRMRITRQALPNQSDRLAVTVRRGGPEDGSAVRATLDALAPGLVHFLFAVGSADSHAVEDLVRIAAADGIELESRRRPTSRYASRIAEVRERRLTLLGVEGAEGETERLRASCRESAAELGSLKQEADRLREELSARFAELASEIEKRRQRVEWLDLERQAIETDLDEAAGRPKATMPPTPGEVLIVERGGDSELSRRIRDIDGRIEHARTVVDDLGRDRMRLTSQIASLAGVEAIDPHRSLRLQRESVTTLEGDVLRLREAAAGLARISDSAERAARLEAEIERATTSLQRRIYALCQHLSRQEQWLRQSGVTGERSQIDRCETELLQHIARLQIERDDLLAQHPGEAGLRHATEHDLAGCACSEHESLAHPAASRRVAAPASVMDVVDVDVARQRERHAELSEALDQARADWRAALAIEAEWDLERSRLVVLERQIAERQVEVDIREQKLSSLIEEGQALLLVEAGLEQMQQSTFDEEQPRVMQEASQHLSRLTDGRYQSLLLSEGELMAISDSGLAAPISALSRGTLDQTTLSLRIALADEYARRGVSLPLVFDDVLVDSDRDRLDAAVELLKEVGARRQVLYFTCQEHLAERFEAAGVYVRDFPGTARKRIEAAPGVPAPHAATLAAAQEDAAVDAVDAVEEEAPKQVADSFAVVAEDADERPRKVHPSEPHWLRVDSAISFVPSLSEQMVRRLGGIGVRTIGDLIEVDAEETELPLEALQITPAQLRIWQAEARLLCCVPDLTGRDAQVLAAVGILLPQELAQADADLLVRKIDRLRGDGRSGWVLEGFVWPDRKTVQNWIRMGQAARTYREACDAIGFRSRVVETPESPRRFRSKKDSSRHFRIDQPSAHRGPRSRRRIGTRGVGRRAFARLGRPESDSDDTQRVHADQAAEGLSVSAIEVEAAAEARELRFNLEGSSPIVEAPSIGPTTARRLERIGVLTVADLLNRDAKQIASRLQHRRVNADIVREWQAQSLLMCRIPELRGHDAQVLIACGLKDADAIARMSPQSLFAVVGPFVATREGQRLLRSAKTPDLAEVTDWITWAQQARAWKAA